MLLPSESFLPRQHVKMVSSCWFPADHGFKIAAVFVRELKIIGQRRGAEGHDFLASRKFGVQDFFRCGAGGTDRVVLLNARMSQEGEKKRRIEGAGRARKAAEKATHKAGGELLGCALQCRAYLDPKSIKQWRVGLVWGPNFRGPGFPLSGTFRDGPDRTSRR